MKKWITEFDYLKSIMHMYPEKRGAGILQMIRDKYPMSVRTQSSVRVQACRQGYADPKPVRKVLTDAEIIVARAKRKKADAARRKANAKPIVLSISDYLKKHEEKKDKIECTAAQMKAAQKMLDSVANNCVKNFKDKQMAEMVEI